MARFPSPSSQPVSRHGRIWGQATWQLLSVLLIWLYLWSLQLDNDGLWYRGDAARHALNGFFWIDYLRDFTWDAKDYALSYYARYPAIDPATRPPLFYLLEGVAFTLFGPSPYVAKGLVLWFALLAAVYLWAWLRRWISEEAGWAVGLFLLLPGISRWSHAVMLNVPAVAFSLAALYHARCWLEAPGGSRRDSWFATVLTLCALFTYYTASVVVFALAGYVMFHRGLGRLSGRKNPFLFVLTPVALLPFAWLMVHWAPTQLSWIISKPLDVITFATWTFYPKQVVGLCNLHLLVFAVLGAASFLWSSRWRHEVMGLGIWIVALYVPLTLIGAKELRYALLLSAPLLGLATIAVVQVCEGIAMQLSLARVTSRTLTVAAFLALLLWQVGAAATYRVMAVSGYQDVAAFMAQVAPEEPVLYDGFYDGTFAFYMRAGDERLRRRVVLGNKLLYTSALFVDAHRQEFVHSPEDVIEVLRQRGGCRWLAIEMGSGTENIASMRYVRQAVKTAAFALVRSFPIRGPQTDRVDVYRFTLPIEAVDAIELPFALLGPEVKYRVRPIPPRP